MARECYSCANGMDSDRTCMSDGDCEWWAPVEYEDSFDELIERTIESMQDEE